jgi:hypothetical protein
MTVSGEFGRDSALCAKPEKTPVKYSPYIETAESTTSGSAAVRVCLLNLIAENDLVGSPTDGLCELASLVITDIAGRRADEPIH